MNDISLKIIVTDNKVYYESAPWEERFVHEMEIKNQIVERLRGIEISDIVIIYK